MSDLEMRPGCECCDADLPPEDAGAVVCSFECTYCAACAGHLGHTCPTCGGELVPRPRRVGAALRRHPASRTRVVSPAACPGRVADAGATGRIRRHPERSRADREELDALLDEVLAGTLSTVVGGRPWAVPMLFARDGDRILLHGSTGAGALRQVAAGAPAALTVIAVDGLVVAHSTFDSSANYRSAVVHGELEALGAAAAAAALDRISDRLLPRRSAEVRATTRRERAATLALALPLVDGRWQLKVRTGGPGEPDEPTDAWCGVVPFRTVAGAPEPAPWTVEADTALPASVRALVDRWPQ